MGPPSNLPLAPPFTDETARLKVRAAEDSWNARDPQRCALAYTLDSEWRNRSEFLRGRDEIIAFLSRKWQRELEYRLIKELWGFREHRMAVRFCYESHDTTGQWYRSYGNELWEFTNAGPDSGPDAGLMRRRIASVNDVAIREEDRLFGWTLGRRPDDHPSLSELGL